MNAYVLLKVPTQTADDLSAEIGALPGVGGIEELPIDGTDRFAVDPAFQVVEFNTATADEFQHWLASEKFRSGDSIFLKVYVAVESETTWHQWLADFQRDFPSLSVHRQGILADQDYTASYRRNVHGQNVGTGLWVGPPWDTPTTGKVPIIIDPGMAFGTGDHATTQLCLESMERLRDEGFQPERILDIGTGSGVLAIGALKLWPASELSISDLDAACRPNAEHNFNLNRLSMPSDAVWGKTEATLGKLKANDFDLVLSNIHLDSLVTMVEQIPDLLQRGGRWIVSGLWGEAQTNEFIGRSAERFEVRSQQQRSDWFMLELAYRQCLQNKS